MTNERAIDTLQSIGWFDGPLFVAPVTNKLKPLLDAAAEKYGCVGAELLQKVLVDCLADMSGEEMMHTIKDANDDRMGAETSST